MLVIVKKLRPFDDRMSRSLRGIVLRRGGVRFGRFLRQRGSGCILLVAGRSR